MVDRPILMNAEMVRATLEGRKTQTRRIVKPQPSWVYGERVPVKTEDADPKGAIRCPFGRPGDRLWVRESFKISRVQCDDAIIHYAGGRYGRELGPCSGDVPDSALVGYFKLIDKMKYFDPARSVPSIHMPRWASRITLEITDVRVERLQEISEEDARAEGLEMDENGYIRMREPFIEIEGGPHPFRTAFRELWSSIYGADSWDANPWVWSVHFKRIAP